MNSGSLALNENAPSHNLEDVAPDARDEFSYLIDKIEQIAFETEPFGHLEIADFLSEDHFDAVVKAPQISIPEKSDNESLIIALEDQGYEAIPFPGCVTSKKVYLDWLNGRRVKPQNACEGFGMAFRMKRTDNPVLRKLDNFFKSDRLTTVLMKKFGLQGPVVTEAGFQKYLHGYEISPHPDIRKKALTWMLNLNPGDQSENLEIHTHYMKFKPERSYIGEFWKHNRSIDRCWVPWDWCETIKQQKRNNSIVFFAPSDLSLHAVRANYDHLRTQRTQFYGNLWHTVHNTTDVVEYAELDIASKGIHATRPRWVVERVAKRVLARVFDPMKSGGYVG